ncbi:non-ribosomal peptide synthetase [Xenorhabdus innexi]|uniref:Amino acid adenylation n=1 Tax=Xenorhabdus innexi TaxID=290109 RepID=A0A2G0N6Y0_9GAMM|nr:non-ribosomal peptide synthetase [Xenorhabdus innexi]PHM30481.1 Amino acid adenylation [Xenorhabdus innexi]BDX17127.1 non-ribosomal peptide synthetase XinA [Xenorhabdus innexi]
MRSFEDSLNSDLYYLHPSQEDVFYEHLLYENSPIHTLNWYTLIENQADITILQKAWDLLHQNIDTLRLRISINSDDEVVQYIQNKSSPELIKYYDISTQPDPENSALLWMKQQVSHPVEFLNEVPYQVTLIRLNDKKYYLLTIFHHIIIDGVGLYHLHEYLHKLYNCIKNGTSIAWVSEIPQYLISVERARAYLNSTYYENDRKYWFDFLREKEIHQLPVYYKNTENDHRTLTLPLSIKNDLRIFCRDNKIHLLAVFSGLVSVLMSEITGQKEIVFNTATHGRETQSEKSVIGMQANTYPVHCHISPTISTIKQIRLMESALKNSYIHRKFPQSHLSRLANQHGFSLPNIFILYDRFSASDPELNQAEHTHIDTTFNIYPIAFRLKDYGYDQELKITIGYLRSYFSDSDIENILTRLGNLLTALINNPAVLVSELPILLEQERHTLLNIWNQTDAPYPQDKTLPQLFEAQVAQRPDATAVVFENQQLSYDELNRRANQLAHHLMTLGVRPDDRVAICLERSPDMVVGLLAILKAGSAYVPLDPTYPVERLDFMLKDAAPRLLLTRASLADQLPRTVPVLHLDELAPLLAIQPDTNPETQMIGLTARHLAYVIYTSGSTGQPKGVMIEHRNVLRLIINSSFADIGPDDCIAHCANISFDAAIWEIWSGLVHGARVLLIPKDILLQPEQFAQSLLSEEVSILFMTTALFNQYADQIAPSLSGLRCVLFGGEQSDNQAAFRLRAGTAPRHLLHLYGPTESTTFATSYEMPLIAPENGRLPIGRPINNTRIYILNSQGHPVPIGAPGEIYVGGDGVARGYLNQPQLTAERFLVDPFSSEPTGRMYKTGDLARWLPDGNIEFLGRNDFQVKIRGFRIELGEIERVLSSHPQVKQAVVIDHENSGNKVLAAYLVTESVLSDSILMEYLASRLPDYMLPASFTFMEAIPLTQNGKVDRRALPKPVWLNRESYVAPRNAQEAQLCTLWQEVLGLERVGVEDNFFRIGGNSLSAIKLIAAIRRVLATEISLAQLFELKTITGLATQLEQQAYTVIPHLSQANYPLSFAQERILFIEQFEQGSDAYHVPYLMQLNDEISLSLLATAVNQLAERHPVMKMVYRSDSDAQVQQQRLDDELVIKSQPCEDITTLLNTVRAEIATPFDLANTFSLRLRHYPVGDNHYLLLLWHHIAIDGWSVSIFMAELTEIYHALRENRDSLLPPLDITYGDYAVWQRNYLQGEIRERQLTYWQQILTGYESLILPTDYPRPAKVSYQGRDFHFRLDTRLSDQLRRLANTQETTLYTVLLSAFYVTLAKLSGQDDILLGTPTDNRHHAQTQPLIGMFVNTLVLRAKITQTDSIATLIRLIHQRVTEAKTHQDIPFEQLLDVLDIERDTSRHPVFQVMFSVQGSGEFPLQEHEMLFRPVELEESLYSPAKFDLFLYLSEEKISAGNSEITACLNYAVSLFKEDTIVRITDIYQRVLAAFVADQEQPLSGIDVLSAQERHTLLHRWSQSDMYYPQDEPLQQLFEKQAEKTPDNVAIVFEEEILTYRQLNEQANQLATVIREYYQQQHNQAMPADTLVALYLDRSPEMVVSILAVLKAGGAYVPVSPEYPQERVRFILNDTRSPCVITQQKYLTELERYSQAQLIAADDQAVIGGRSVENPAPVSNAADLAYVIYTSGTTGQPKGVLQTHENVGRLFASTQAEYQFNQNDIWVLYHAYTFDFSVWELWGALLYGGRLVIPPIECTKDFDRFSHLCSVQQVTVLNQTPGAFYAFIDAALNRRTEFPHLRYVIFGGDKLNPVQLRPWWDHYGDQSPALINMYGITETTVHVTYKKLTRNDTSAISCIGRPLSDMAAYILDSAGQPVPVGATGELYIGGGGLARGYLNRAELTAERFVENPFSTEKDRQYGYTRLYKTGDLARWLPDGELEYLGRNDFQVKIRGFRIELGEIESALASHPLIRQAVVIDHHDKGNTALVAYLVTEGELSDESLVKYLSSRLPEYMLPASFTRLEAIPLTLNGKLDRRALPEPVFSNKESYIAPRNELETQLCHIWQNVLELERVGIEDNFFRIGGNSLTAVKLIAAIRRILATEVSLAQLFEQKTIAGLATQMETQIYTVIPHLETERYPLSFAQERMLFIEQFEQGTNAYHIPYLVQLDNKNCLPLLETAINRLTERHPIMKMVYRSNDEGIIYPELRDENLLIQSGSCNDTDHLLNTVHAEVTTPFDLTTEPSLRLRHYQVSDQHYLLLLWHHIAIDGWSIDIFMDELAEIYHALLEGHNCQLPLLEISYGDYAAWQRSYLQGEIREHQLAYWRQALADYESLDLPTDYSRPAQMSYQGQNVNFVLNEQLSGQLRTLAKTQETTLYTVLLSAFYVALAKLSGQSDIVLGTPTDNRHHAQTQPLIGMFVNSLALRAQIQQTDNVENLIGQIHQRVTEAKAHQDMPFEQLIDALDIERDTARHPIFQVMFSVQRFGENPPDRRLPFIPTAINDSLYNSAKFDLSLFISDGQNEISGCLNYAISLFNEETIIRLTDIYQRILAAFAADQKQSLSAIDILSAQERHTLLYHWNQTNAPYPRDKTFAQLFEAQAAQTPDATAVISEDRQISYGELNQRANRLAHHLIELGVHPDDRVAICIERSPEMIVGLLAILKAGGAYVPLDPAYPDERLAYMVKNSSPIVLLTHSTLRQKIRLHTQPETETTDPIPIIMLDAHETFTGIQTEHNPDISGITSQHLAYVIYTSGSTGAPKGVMCSHQALNNRLWWFVRNIAPSPLVTAMKTSISFVDSVTETLGTLLAGGKLVVFNDHDVKDPARLCAGLYRFGVNSLVVVPSLLKLLIQHHGEHNLASIKTLVCSGELLPPELARQTVTGFPWLRLLNFYGSSEVNGDAVWYEYSTALGVPEVSVIGRPIANTRCYILDPHGQPVPFGVVGEIHIGGDNVARGYLNRPDLTAERFLADPFSPEPNGHMYKTGDLARWLPDGNIEYLGRNDFQIKIRGYRIELGEIESALSSHPQVKQAVVIDYEYNAGNKQLAAYLVAEETLSDETLTEYLSSRLPEYMLPASFTFMDAIPLTLNGKVNRRALPEPIRENRESYVAPRNELESQLCTIWQTVLGMERIGIDDNFFRIGGDSITSIQLVSQLRQAGFTLQVKSIFDAPTVARLAKLLTAMSSPVTAVSERYKDEIPYWNQILAGNDIRAEAGELTPHQFALSAEMTDILLHESGSGYHTEINDLLLSALAQALSETFSRPVNHIMLAESRQESAGITLYPVRLEIQPDTAETIIYTKEMLRSIPNLGVGYSVLAQANSLIGHLPVIRFSYSGQSDTCGSTTASENSTHLLLSINGAVREEKLQFSVNSRLPQSRTEAFIRAFEQALHNVITNAQKQAQSGGLKTPSDYGITQVSMEQLNQITQRFNRVNDANPHRHSEQKTILDV